MAFCASRAASSRVRAYPDRISAQAASGWQIAQNQELLFLLGGSITISGGTLLIERGAMMGFLLLRSFFTR
jgi:hypothetical protein